MPGESDGTDDGAENLVWAVIRQDDNGNRYRVGRYATREEAQRVCDVFESRGHKQLYVIEKIDRRRAS
ncbi:SPOR domain-containing protein [Streptomyces sp. RB6PN25]|uniref:SPOR domain-containing protein n=1 Tax=Streptomyces humicola TaxID=2953240 RepID=A0ABT1PXE2_9ACTN|nr:SPOR domain-containing protein [Streptomyces humicola]MCQ4082351.1 SPOR domain-containing protein [Streptomyces humicola]